ncbi:MAG: DUF2304 domain-containing protein [Moorellaceae bacterium]
MLLNVHVLTILIALGFTIGVLDLVRRGQLMERYAILWLLVSVVVMGFAVWPKGLDRMAQKLGVHYAPAFLFLVSIIFCFSLLLHLSVAVSRLRTQVTRLAQEVALLKLLLTDHCELTTQEEMETCSKQ